MGLDISPGSFHCGYSAFHQWRESLAAAIGYNLETLWYDLEEGKGPRDEPLLFLLDHSDCDGEIAYERVAPLMDRLKDVSRHVPDGNDQRLVGLFLEACQLALERQEDLVFG